LRHRFFDRGSWLLPFVGRFYRVARCGGRLLEDFGKLARFGDQGGDKRRG
jgi:hypothetical protein